MANTGTAILTFLSPPGSNTTTTTITGQAGILSGSYVEAFMMADSTADHNSTEHTIVPIKLVCGDIVVGTGFTIHATCDWRVSRTFQCRWVWI